MLTIFYFSHLLTERTISGATQTQEQKWEDMKIAFLSIIQLSAIEMGEFFWDTPSWFHG